MGGLVIACARAEDLDPFTTGPDAGPTGSGGTMAGGASNAGGSSATGGAGRSSGGANNGGTTTGGANGSGGSGGGSGGGVATGGSSATGGATTSGGAPNTGGPTGTVTFGGAYETNGPQCTTAACYTANPAAGACGCPSGFTAVGPLPVLDDRACPSNNPPFGWSSVDVCVAGAFAANADFGGVYQRDSTGKCTVGNAMASGQCACPTGSQAIDLQADSGCWLNTTIGFCWNGTAPRTKFGGAYQESDSKSQGTNGCVVANPATAGCSCPAGTSGISMRTVWGPSNSGCKNDGTSGGHLVVCAAP